MSNEALKRTLEMYETLDRRVFESREDERRFFFEKGMERAAEIVQNNADIQSEIFAEHVAQNDAGCALNYGNIIEIGAQAILREVNP